MPKPSHGSTPACKLVNQVEIPALAGVQEVSSRAETRSCACSRWEQAREAARPPAPCTARAQPPRGAPPSPPAAASPALLGRMRKHSQRRISRRQAARKILLQLSSVLCDLVLARLRKTFSSHCTLAIH